MIAAFHRMYARIRRSKNSSPGNAGSLSGYPKIWKSNVFFMSLFKKREHQITSALRAGMLDKRLEGLLPLSRLLGIGID
jgi:hypothetical protein